jgi:hypothetical protein
MKAIWIHVTNSLWQNCKVWRHLKLDKDLLEFENFFKRNTIICNFPDCLVCIDQTRVIIKSFIFEVFAFELALWNQLQNLFRWIIIDFLIFNQSFFLGQYRINYRGFESHGGSLKTFYIQISIKLINSRSTNFNKKKCKFI